MLALEPVVDAELDYLPSPRNHEEEKRMARKKTPAQLQAELDNAHEYIEELETKLDSIAGIATGDDDDNETDSEEEDDEDLR